MKYLRSIGIVLVFLCRFCLLFNEEAQAKPKKDMQFSIIFEKDEYKLDDSISVELKLKNTGDKPVYVNKRFFVNSKEADPGEREVTLRIIGPSGEEAAFRTIMDTGFPKSDYFVLLAPGEEAAIDRKKNLKAYFDLKAPGKYKVTAIYQNAYGSEIGLDVFKEKITSKTVTIRVGE